MDAHVWHQQATIAAPPLPAPLSRGDFHEASDSELGDYAQLVRTGLRARPLASPIHDGVAARLSDVLDSARLEPPGARTILSLSAPFAAGKSTLIKRWAYQLHRTWLHDHLQAHPSARRGGEHGLVRWAPRPGYMADLIPVSYMTLLSDSRGIDLYAQLLAFANRSAGGPARTLIKLAVDSFAMHGTKLVIVDDAHMLRTTSVTGRATLNAVKHLNTELGELGAVLVLVGANLTGGDVLQDDQIRGRLAQHSFRPYEIDTEAGRREWQRFLKNCETTLLPYLPHNNPGDLAQRHSTYLWLRTQGFVSDAARLLIDATAASIVARRPLDRTGLDNIALSQRAQDGQIDVGTRRAPPGSKGGRS